MGAFQKVTIILVHRNVYGGHGAFKLLKPFSGRAELGGAAYDAYFCMPGSKTQLQGEHSSHFRLPVGHHDIHGIRIPYQPPGLFGVPGPIFLSLLSGAPCLF